MTKWWITSQSSITVKKENRRELSFDNENRKICKNLIKSCANPATNYRRNRTIDNATSGGIGERSSSGIEGLSAGIEDRCCWPRLRQVSLVRCRWINFNLNLIMNSFEFEFANEFIATLISIWIWQFAICLVQESDILWILNNTLLLQ